MGQSRVCILTSELVSLSCGKKFVFDLQTKIAGRLHMQDANLPVSLLAYSVCLEE